MVQQATAHTEREHAERVAQAERHVVEMEEKLAALERYRKEYEDGFAARAGAGLGVAAMRDFQAFLARLGDALEQQRQVVETGARRAPGRDRCCGAKPPSARTWSTRWPNAGRSKSRARKAAAISATATSCRSSSVSGIERASHDFQCRAAEPPMPPAAPRLPPAIIGRHRRIRRLAGAAVAGQCGCRDRGALRSWPARWKVPSCWRTRWKTTDDSTDDDRWSRRRRVVVSRRVACRRRKCRCRAVAAGASVCRTDSERRLSRLRAAPARLPPRHRAIQPTDLAQALSFAGADCAAGDSQSPAPDTKAAATPVIDTTTWNSLSGSAELFAQCHAARDRGARRIRAADHPCSRSALGGRSRQPAGVDGAHRRIVRVAAIDAGGPGAAGSQRLGSRQPGHRAFRRRECRDARAAGSVDAAPAGNARVRKGFS